MFEVLMQEEYIQNHPTEKALNMMERWIHPENLFVLNSNCVFSV